MNRTMRLLAATAVATAVLALSACTSSSHSNSANCDFHFTSANKSGSTIAVAKRKTCEITGNLINGGNYSLAQDKGKVVVLNFWAAWCAPCQVETPQFDLMYRQNKGKGVDFVGIDTKDIKSNAESFIKDHDITFPIVYDEPGEAALALGNLPVQGMPFSVVIDKQSRVAGVYIGRQSPADLQPVLNTLLAET